jgi:hypothetical protein
MTVKITIEVSIQERKDGSEFVGMDTGSNIGQEPAPVSSGEVLQMIFGAMDTFAGPIRPGYPSRSVVGGP